MKTLKKITWTAPLLAGVIYGLLRLYNYPPQRVAAVSHLSIPFFSKIIYVRDDEAGPDVDLVFILKTSERASKKLWLECKTRGGKVGEFDPGSVFYEDEMKKTEVKDTVMNLRHAEFCLIEEKLPNREWRAAISGSYVIYTFTMF